MAAGRSRPRSMKKTASRSGRPQTIDEYLAPVPPHQRAALNRLRAQILKAAPGAEEVISYGMPGFRLNGRMLVWMGAAASHCAFYPGGLVGEFAGELEPY